MKLCQKHWGTLHGALTERGLIDMMPAELGTPPDNTFSEQQETLQDEDYNPLLAANLAIWKNAMTNFGMEVFLIPDFCPICFIQEHNQQCTICEVVPDWINLVANEQFDIVKERNLIVIN